MEGLVASAVSARPRGLGCRRRGALPPSTLYQPLHYIFYGEGAARHRAALVGGTTSDGAAKQGRTVQLGDARFTVLGPRSIRMEHRSGCGQAASCFDNEPSTTFVNRAPPIPAPWQVAYWRFPLRP